MNFHRFLSHDSDFWVPVTGLKLGTAVLRPSTWARRRPLGLTRLRRRPVPTREQAQQIRESLRPSLGYLERLIARMQQAGFPANDPLLARALTARNAIHDLGMALHYAGCNGVAKPK